MKIGFRSVVMAVIIMLALASASIAADPIQLGPAGGPGHDEAICPGTSVTFSVDAGTTSGPHYEWKLGTSPAPDATDSPTYEAKAAGTYTCKVTGTCAGEAISEEGRVTMLVPPVIL